MSAGAAALPAGSPSSAPALEARGLRVSLAGREVLHGIDLTLPAGRWTAVAGPNGAGKTTLLKALAGLLPMEGEVRLLGRARGTLSARDRARLLAWLGQNEGGAEDLRAGDVVLLGRLPHQGWLAAPSAADHAAVERAMRRTGCWEWRERTLGRLSGGERQRVLMARALAVEAALLLMDEPLANLDPPHQADWLALVRVHVRAGGTAVSVLHEIGMALHADALVLLADGRVAHQGDCTDPATHRAVERVFGGRIAVHPVGRAYVALPVEDLN
ncbi:ABC transporter ATP-binding protein [Ramlibacter sp. AN1015]|uniref:ABC transporter ATP-binding protein n=1 Tax=Ramlibacter sp. AN1015 TaxID=3133428 RepID=UPI0030C33827